MIHIRNLPFILETGEIRCASHPNADSAYTPIGDATLIQSRSHKTIPKAPGGGFQDYVSFYFGVRTPMLYVIQRGFNEVNQLPQGEIIYLVTTVQNVLDYTHKFVFFDGHAYEILSQCFNSVNELNNVDWIATKARQWASSSDPDLKRRKQAEFLVYSELPVNHLHGIAVYSNEAKEQVTGMLSEFDVALPVKIKNSYYY